MSRTRSPRCGPVSPASTFDTTIYRPASYIEESIDNVTLALDHRRRLLVLLVLAAFFFDWRAALVAIVAIPLSLVAAGLVLYALGETINAMVVAGLVGGARPGRPRRRRDVETSRGACSARRREDSDDSATAVVLEASLEMRGAMVYATLIVALAVLPLFVLEGIGGRVPPAVLPSRSCSPRSRRWRSR